MAAHAIHYYGDIAAALLAAHDRVEELEKELNTVVIHARDSLEGKAIELEDAYREGFADGDCWRGPNPTPEGTADRAWLDSDTKAHLDYQTRNSLYRKEK
jgi:hypothetical protein